MAITFDTLGMSKYLQASGVVSKQADAHAHAARDYIMPELATKSDMQRLEHLIERQGLLLTVRLGGLLVVGIGALGVLLQITGS